MVPCYDFTGYECEFKLNIYIERKMRRRVEDSEKERIRSEKLFRHSDKGDSMKVLEKKEKTSKEINNLE